MEPLQSFEACGHEAIGASIRTNLIAPMVLTSSFIKYTENYPIRRKVVNISSAASFYPLSGMGTYCTAKAGINMFTSCVGAEQADKPNPVEIMPWIPAWLILRCSCAAEKRRDLPWQSIFGVSITITGLSRPHGLQRTFTV
ncbi:short-subunit dehydrogenase involved in D-alanine esterification of teichoic acids [Paenibacillus mucilaginosus]|uniref:SDR family NAD(P)-dependent oxidoreductase n=1 Tax=Paenibacillus mucilaginosus TaxID=61624 RepID=UPI003D2013E6